MRKNKKWGGLITLALLAMLVYVIWSGQRPPNYEAEALKRIPESCDVLGVWRNDDYPETNKGMRNTMVMCGTSEGRKVWTVYDDSWGEMSVLINESGLNPRTPGDMYTVLPDGTLTISDAEGELLRLEPYTR